MLFEVSKVRHREKQMAKLSCMRFDATPPRLLDDIKVDRHKVMQGLNFFLSCDMMPINDSLLLQVSDSNLPRNWLPIRTIMINPALSQRCRCVHRRASMFWIDGSATISEEQSLTPGLRPCFHAVSSLFEPNFENGRGSVALISKAVASSFSYRTGEEKKKEKKV